MNRPFALCLLVVAALAPGPVSAQLPDTLSERARASLVTVTQGDAVYSLFGHSALRITDPETGLDIVFNYGTFDFSAPWFIPKFVYGILQYQLSASSMRALMLGSEMERRGVISHELALTQAELEAMYSALLENLRPENRTYRYDFFFDNCSTRIRDVVAAAAPVTWTADETQGRSLRTLLDPWVIHRPWLDTGMDLILGSVTDGPAEPRQADFLPLLLDASFREATVTGPDGSVRPLVARTDTLSWVPERESIPPTFPWPGVIGWLAASFALLMTWRSRSSLVSLTSTDRWALGLLGTVGIVIAFLTFFSEHAAMAHNYNVLWALPTHLVAALAARRLSPRWLGLYLALTAGLALLALSGGRLIPQQVPFALYPLVILLTVRYGWIARQLLTVKRGGL